MNESDKPGSYPRMSPSTLFTPERWRKPVSFLFTGIWLVAAMLVIPRGFDDGWHEALEMSGYLLLICAALGRVWAYAYIGGRKNQRLCREGPYSLTRNPLYFFSFLGVCGAGLGLQSLLLFGTACIFFLGYYAWVIRAEERRLDAIFGSEFRRYCAEVPRFWPRLANPQCGEEITLSARLFTRTLGEVFWFLAAIVIIEVVEIGKMGHWWLLVPTSY